MNDEPQFLGVVGWISLLLIPPEMGTMLWMHSVVVPSFSALLADFGGQLPVPTIALISHRTIWLLLGEAIPLCGLAGAFIAVKRAGYRDAILAITAFAGLLYILLAWVALYLPIFSMAAAIQ